MATISKPIVIPKHHLKVMFSIDVDEHANVNISGTRFVEVAHKEDFNMNVKFCKNEHLRVLPQANITGEADAALHGFRVG